MSSDESTSTQLSITSNIDGKKDKLKPHNSEPWEINLIGNFLLGLYHRSIIGHDNQWNIRKSFIRKEYSTYITEDLSKKLHELNGTADIGTMLHRCRFLINTTRGSPFFKIKFSTLFEFRNNKLKELDNLKINCDGKAQEATSDKNKPENVLLKLSESNSNILVPDYEVDDNEEKKSLEYQGTVLRRRLDNYYPTNMSCCICEEDFTTIETYEEHIEKHGEDTDFEFLTTMDKLSSPIFSINYRLCKNSHYFCFEIETDADDLIIEKIIIVQSRSFFYVHNMQVPYKCPENGKDRFFVDSHLFTIHVEQPIVLIFHRENNKEIRIIEQHHFMRSEEFPKVNFSINPYRLPDKKRFTPKIPLLDYFPPREIQEALKDDFYHQKLMRTSNGFCEYIKNGKNLQPQNIGTSLEVLLQIEDMDTILQYVDLTQKNIKLRNYGDEYSFRLKPKQRIFIENLLSTYDEVVLTTRTDIFTNNEEIIKLISQNKSDIERMKNTFVGIIQAVNTGRISFKCDQKINIKSEYTIICRPSRLTLRYQYRSLGKLPENINFLKKFLFPTKIIPRPLSNMNLKLYNQNVNGEQLQAVRNIAEGPRNDATYIIFGPPGTGKTTTLVEAILQLLKKDNTKILVTASSNSACDEVAKRLCKYLKDLDIKRAMVRIYSRSSEIRTETIDDELLENSNMYNGQFYPDIEILHEYRIVVCTLSVVAKLALGKFGSPWYTHLFIDEVAATTEAEALIGITTILSSQSCLIISGDHKQLGPILKSKRAKELGLDISLMDRLLARDCYRVDVDTSDYDRTIQTRLIQNYRSHPAIVNLFSGLYYNHTLEAHAKMDDVTLCENWYKSRNKQFPILFHAIYEPSRTDNQSHSLYNLCELNVVMDYVKDLMYFGINGKPVKENDIGIISPYKNQYKRIQEELNLRKWFSIETGSVETFQGKEKDIIIVSFVRSGTSNLGFLENPRRLNVTISRPKSLLILIGNPQTLSLNSDFQYIIKECQRNNTFVGATAPKKGDYKKQTSVNMTKSANTESELTKGDKGNSKNKTDLPKIKVDKLLEDKLSALNKSLQTLNLEKNTEKSKNENVPKKTNNTTKRNRSKRRNGRNISNINDEKLNEKKDENNKDDDDVNDDDDDDEDENSDSNDDSDKASTSVNSKNKTNSKKNSKRANNQRKLNNKSKANDGKISKKYVKTNQNKFDSFLDELPRVPTTTKSPPLVTTLTFSNPQYAQLQEQQRQQQNYNNFPQQQHFNNFGQQHPLNNYNNTNVNYAGFNNPYHTPAPPMFSNHMIQQPHNINPYVTHVTYGNPNLFSLPTTSNAVIGNNTPPITNNHPVPNLMESKINPYLSTKAERQHRSKPREYRNKNINTNAKKNMNTNNFKTAKENKFSNSENSTKKSSKVAANIHGISTNNSNRSQENKNNITLNKSTVAAAASNMANTLKKPDLNTSNINTGKTTNNSVKPSKTYNSERASLSANSTSMTSNHNTDKPSTSASYSANSLTISNRPISSISTNYNTPTQNPNKTNNSERAALTANSTSLAKPSTSASIYPSIRSTTSVISSAQSVSYSANSPTSSLSKNYNPPTNPYLSTYSPSAPFVDINRPTRNLSFDDNKSKNKKECIIS